MTIIVDMGQFTGNRPISYDAPMTNVRCRGKPLLTHDVRVRPVSYDVHMTDIVRCEGSRYSRMMFVSLPKRAAVTHA